MRITSVIGPTALVNKGLAKWMRTTDLRVSLQGYVNLIIKNFHHVTFFFKKRIFFYKMAEKL
jgi:hypothetical protein